MDSDGKQIELCHTFADPPAGEWTCYELETFKQAAVMFGG